MFSESDSPCDEALWHTVWVSESLTARSRTMNFMLPLRPSVPRLWITRLRTRCCTTLPLTPCLAICAKWKTIYSSIYWLLATMHLNAHSFSMRPDRESLQWPRIGTRCKPLGFEPWLGITLWLIVSAVSATSGNYSAGCGKPWTKSDDHPIHQQNAAIPCLSLCLHRRHRSKRPWFVLKLVWAHRCSRTAQSVGCAEFHK